MRKKVQKIAQYIKQYGLASACMRAAFNLKNKFFLRKIFSSSDNKTRFTKIYEENYWGSQESRSGTGSTILYTTNLRRQLPLLFSKFGVKSVFDAPCGDFNWMSQVMGDIRVQYIGADIVQTLIDENKNRYENDNILFLHLDITRDELPYADLMLCRDFLMHLSYADTREFFKKYIKSKIPYLLLTSHVTADDFNNSDIQTADFRLTDLFKPPYNMPKNVLYEIEDWLKPEPPRKMYLWSRDQVIYAFENQMFSKNT
jgi:SAM-dependent methyltransferase